jgi:hypothetical protein
MQRVPHLIVRPHLEHLTGLQSDSGIIDFIVTRRVYVTRRGGQRQTLGAIRT